MSRFKGKNLPLFATVTGSHMWKMERPDSDIDIYSCYIRDTTSYFIQGPPISSHNKMYLNEKGIQVDEQSHELSKVIKYLKKGNLNFIYLVCSPKIEYEHRTALAELRQIFIDNLSKNCYYSTQGMARNNIKKYLFKKDVPEEIYQKKLNTIGRNIQFGINLILYHKPVFEPIEIQNKKELDDLMLRLDQAYKNSPLPLSPDPEPFDNYVMKWRMRKLIDDFPDIGKKTK